jgi:signal transduction histidine kinase
MLRGDSSKLTKIDLAKYAISWKLFFIAMSLSIIAGIFDGKEIDSWWNIWRAILTEITSHIFPCFVFLLLDITIFRNRNTQRITFPIIIFSGFILGFSTAFSNPIMESMIIEGRDNLLVESLNHGINSGLLGTILFPAAALYLYIIESYRVDREKLIAERMLIESKKAESKAIVKALRSSMSQKVDENLFEIITNSKEFFDENSRSLEQNWNLMAEKLRTAALETIRPFSHNLHRRGEEKKYSVQLSEFLAYIAENMSINIPLVAIIYAVIDFKLLFNLNYSLTSEISLLLGHIFLIIIILSLNRRLLHNNFYRRLLPFLVLLSIDCGLFVVITSYFHTFLGLPTESTTSQIFRAIYFFGLILFISMISTLISGSEGEKRFLMNRISQAQLEHRFLSREEARVSRELAKYLHGTMQSQLMASAIRLERAGKSGDPVALQREVNEAYANLKLPSASYFSAPRHSLKEEIQKVIETWDNLMTVKVDLPELTMSLPAQLIQDIGNAINEGLANSFRHGSATKVEISLLETKVGILIDLVDDGIHPGKGRPGLGSEYFDTISGGGWSLKPTKSGGSHLNLLVPV